MSRNRSRSRRRGRSRVIRKCARLEQAQHIVYSELSQIKFTNIPVTQIIFIMRVKISFSFRVLFLHSAFLK